MPGPLELVIIAAVAISFVAVPVAIAAIVVFIVKKSESKA